jgi:hypothetical protein
MRTHRTLGAVVTVAALVCALAVATATASADNGFAFTDWTSNAGGVTGGTLLGRNVVLSGPVRLPSDGTVLDDSYIGFGTPNFTPILADSDTGYLVAAGPPGDTYTLTFSSPVTDPVFDFASVGSILTFPAGSELTRISGDAGLTVSGNVVTGQTTPFGANGDNDSNGTVRLQGTVSSLTLQAVSNLPNPSQPDGVYVQVGAAVVEPRTDIVLTPGQSSRGPYLGPVGVQVEFFDDNASGSVETRCVLDPPVAPASFDDMAPGCPYLGGGQVSAPGTHTVYAASRDALGTTSAPVSRTFQIAVAPDTKITSGPTGTVWDPSIQFTFVSTIPGSTFRCQADGGAFLPCTSPYRATVQPGGRSFQVRAVSPDGVADPTPAGAAFTLGSPTSHQMSCQVLPVYWGVVTLEFAHLDRYACEIGSPVTGGCPSTNQCLVNTQVCPTGARCTVTTQLSWFDDDTHLNWSPLAESGLEPATSDFGGGLTIGSGLKPVLDQTAVCQTGFDGDRCTATATEAALGTGNRPMFSGCSASLPFGGGVLGVSKAGADNVRRIECQATWQIQAAPALTPILGPSGLQFSTASAGTLTMIASLLGTHHQARAATSSKAAISPIHATITHAGVITLPLKLNAAARNLLKRNKKLPIQVKTTFAATGAGPVTTTSRLTLRTPAARPRTCRPAAKRSKHRSTCVWRRASSN